jgi:uracil-DNA glycosylase
MEHQLYICGQAPSRQGDGRPFTGPSGQRLVKLFGFRDYEHMASEVTLMNVLDRPETNLCNLPAKRGGNKRRRAGDEFDRDEAAIKGFGIMLELMQTGHKPVVLALGNEVCLALTGVKISRYKGRKIPGRDGHEVDVWHFPHPSGASHYWNDPKNTAKASEFLIKLLKRYGIAFE